MSDGGPVVPLLHPCIKCGLRVEAGSGPGDLAWHDCEEVAELRLGQHPPPPPPPPGMDYAMDQITMTISARAHQMNGRELAEVIDALARFRAAGPREAEGGPGGFDRQLQTFLANRE